LARWYPENEIHVNVFSATLLTFTIPLPERHFIPSIIPTKYVKKKPGCLSDKLTF